MDGSDIKITGGTEGTVFSFPECTSRSDHRLAKGDVSSLITKWKADHPNAAETTFHLRDAMAYPENKRGGDFGAISDEKTQNEWPLTLIITNADQDGESNFYFSNGDRDAHCTFNGTFNTGTDLTLGVINEWSHEGEGIDIYSIEIQRDCEDTASTTTTEVPNDNGNPLCDPEGLSWNIIKGDWRSTPSDHADDEDCAVKNTNSGAGNILWFGSEDGLTPNIDYVDNAFVVETEFEIHSGNDAGLLFRTGESSTKNDEGPSYFVGLYPGSGKVVFGTMDDGWSAKHSVSIPALSYNTRYRLSVHGSGHLYTVYLNGQVIMEKIKRTEFVGGSIGLRTYYAPSTYYSLSYQKINGFGDHEGNRQCIVREKEYSDDRLDNPIFEGGGFIGTMTLAECMSHCDLSQDSKGRPCVAIEWSDGGILCVFESDCLETLTRSHDVSCLLGS